MIFAYITTFKFISYLQANSVDVHLFAELFDRVMRSYDNHAEFWTHSLLDRIRVCSWHRYNMHRYIGYKSYIALGQV
jgi:hypothetical protein